MSLAVFFLLLGLLGAEVSVMGVDWAAPVGAALMLMSAATLAELRRTPMGRKARA
ncbi:MAG TPA: hypothetical protein VHE80_11625 [Acidimicrobiales bacterium]|nr:hypothetical protein [Acidimicrobiales bacterium]